MRAHDVTATEGQIVTFSISFSLPHHQQTRGSYCSNQSSNTPISHLRHIIQLHYLLHYGQFCDDSLSSLVNGRSELHSGSAQAFQAHGFPMRATEKVDAMSRSRQGSSIIDRRHRSAGNETSKSMSGNVFLSRSRRSLISVRPIKPSNVHSTDVDLMDLATTIPFDRPLKHQSVQYGSIKSQYCSNGP